jgi:hypothetical protein
LQISPVVSFAGIVPSAARAISQVKYARRSLEAVRWRLNKQRRAAGFSFSRAQPSAAAPGGAAAQGAAAAAPVMRSVVPWQTIGGDLALALHVIASLHVSSPLCARHTPSAYSLSLSLSHTFLK